MNFKSKNFRIIMFSVIGLTVLALVVLLLTLTAPDDEDDEDSDTTTTTTADPALVLQPEDNGDIESITVENSLGTYTVRLEDVDGTDTWVIDGSSVDTDLIDQSSLESLATAVTDMTARSVIEEDAEDLSQYGLDDPQARVTVNYSNAEFVLLIGDTVTSGSANYIMVEGNPSVYSYYTYLISTFITSDELTFVSTAAMPAYDSDEAPEIKKITVTRKDLDQPIILEALPEPDEDSIQVYSYTFTSPYDVYLDLTTGTEYLYAIFGLEASKAAYLEVTDETKAATGLDDPFCEVDVLVGDVIYRLYIGDAITQEVIDEETGVTTTETIGYYGISNKVPGIIYIFSASDIIWATMEPDDYMSEQFLMPYIYDIDTVVYKDTENEFTATIEGNADENTIYLDGEETDGDNFRSFYQFLVGCRGEEIYTDESRGDFIAEFTYNYRDGRDSDTVTLYSSEDDRKVIIAINGKNVFKCKWNYQTRLIENAQALIDGGEIVLNY